MGWCTAQCEMLLFHANTIMCNPGNIELAHLKKQKERRKNTFAHFVSSWFGTFTILFHSHFVCVRALFTYRICQLYNLFPMITPQHPHYYKLVCALDGK